MGASCTQDEVPPGFGFADSDDGWLQRMRAAQAAGSLGTVGSYELKKEVGRGGQGVVYLAYQRGTNRQIALKRLLAGRFATETTRRRFEREIETLASLKHPSIVTAFSVDVVDEIPFLAMEWIEGVPITTWAACRNKGLPDIRAMVHLFLKVCDAIGHAHVHGVIHRDLKPSNILVDAASEPHVLDFGLAKLVGENAGRDSSTTNTERFIGTLAYASPEHLRRTSRDVDVRSDIYSLGVVFYEMLTGHLPYNVDSGLAETAQAIEHVEPARPSVCNRAIDRDLESITFKLLAKDKGSRYQSIDALCADLHGYLSGEPVSARMTGIVTLLLKTVRRHRLACGFAAAIFLLVAAFGVPMSSMYVRARDAEEVAEQRLVAMATLGDRAESEADVAQAEARKTQAITAVLHALITMQDSMSFGGDLASRQKFDQMGQLVSEQLAGFPDVAAGIQTTPDGTQADLGSSAPSLVRAGRQISIETEPVFITTAWSRREEGDLVGAERLCRDYLTLVRDRHGTRHPLLVEGLRLLVLVCLEQGKLSQAEEVAREFLSIEQDSSMGVTQNLIRAVALWGGVQWARKDYEAAEHFLRRAAAMQGELTGDESPEMGGPLNSLAVVLRDQGRYDEALPMFLRALSLTERFAGDDHRYYANVLNNLARLLYLQGDYSQGEQYIRKALHIRCTALPASHPEVVESTKILGMILARTENMREREPVARDRRIPVESR